MKEIWKDIQGYEGSYQVSNNQRIKSLPRKIIRTNGSPFTVRELILKKRLNFYGYHEVTIWSLGKKKNHRVHRLMMTAFKGFSTLQVNHINGIKTDNSLPNLEYVTCLENINHAVTVLQGKKKYGVTFNSVNKCWTSEIYYNKQRKYIGSFKCKEEAYQSFHDKYSEIHGVSPW